tara:strand:+ start:341 stop:481 length:141 start_codon:yes stop_codon:yes gene_type:complete
MSRAAGMAIALKRERVKVKELEAQIADLENKVDYLFGELREARMIE